MFELSPRALDELAFALGPRAGRGKADLASATRAGKGIVAPSHFAAGVFCGSTHAQRSQNAIKTLQRTASRVPEVTVKITGKQTGAEHVLANFTYIAREGWGDDKELELETEQGQLITSHEDKLELAQTWQAREMDDPMRRRGATSLSFVLSMPPGTDPEKVKDAARDFAQTEFGQHRWVMALHTDEPHPHVHLTVTRKGAERTRLNPSKEDCFRYRQTFAEKLRDRGVEANATPRSARGITAKADRTPLVKMRERGVTPKIDLARDREARAAATAGRVSSIHDARAQQDRTVVTAAFNRAISELQTSSDPKHREIAQSLAKFVTTMPEPKTRHQALVDEIKSGRTTPPQPPRTSPAESGNQARSAEDRLAGFKDRLATLATPSAIPAPTPSDEKRAGQRARLQAIIDGKQHRPVAREEKILPTRSRGASNVGQIVDRSIERHRDISKENERDKGGPKR